MARSSTNGRSRGGGVAASLRGLIETIAERVAERMQKQLPGRDEMKSLERQIRDLTKRVEARGLGPRRVGRPRSDRKCSLRGCGLPHVAQGFCSKHYQAWRRRNLAAAAKQATARRAPRRGRRTGATAAA